MWLMFSDLNVTNRKSCLEDLEEKAKAGSDVDRNILDELKDGGDAQIGYLMEREDWLVLDKSNFK